jgi:hypothetical protein
LRLSDSEQRRLAELELAHVCQRRVEDAQGMRHLERSRILMSACWSSSLGDPWFCDMSVVRRADKHFVCLYALR